MKIVVLVKQVPDTEEERRIDPATGLLDRAATDGVADEINERAVEVALRYKDVHKGTEVKVISMGPKSVTPVLRKALSMGADSAVHILDDALAGSDAMRTSAVLAAALTRTGFDLVIAGNESTDGRGGVVPAMIAEYLSLPMLSSLNSADISDQRVVGECSVETGTLTVRATLPAIISVTERSAEARFPNFKGIMTAKRKPLATWSLDDLDIEPADPATSARSVVLAVIERPARAVGKKVVDTGNAGAELAEFLVAGRII
ncbi:electron transfer flavoprotein subunit beta/FixA family protein [Arthrobacter sp. FW306-2-2C-D06B]|uniref:electron transfer flavoprotein subunit beta/FixA family protein n=1 Tax=Arthrobacter sp. FW306-2-2C-D06B TaxID=2879618 RepID=UPI001F294CBA|nr:electron transfer flavoprotein subunit beta/FixA family protein [Arthrobacter sp. FW306-2-2C-D06B]UKA60498.1 electron transfer flavoprotein subunit beta/FixA family protein [Arthrobacter sp. FW306-2-2C-D06B]